MKKRFHLHLHLIFTKSFLGGEFSLVMLKKKRAQAEKIFLQVDDGEKIPKQMSSWLEKEGFVQKKGNETHLNFSIIKGEEFEKLKQTSKSCAKFVFEKNSEKILHFHELLTEHQYTNNPLIWFSLILDGQIWNLFEKRHKLTYQRVPKEKGVPRGTNGYYWITPKIKKHIGTNSYDYEGMTIKLNWSETLLKNAPHLNNFFWNQAHRLIDLYQNPQKELPEETLQYLKKYQFIDNQKKLLILIWKSNSIADQQSHQIAQDLAQAFATYWKKNQVHQIFSNQEDSKYNFCIFYHLSMSDFLNILEKKNLLTYNQALFSKVNLSHHSLADLILIQVP